jgi:hypothetical protein
MVDGLPESGAMPGLYVLWARRESASDVIDDGDAFQFIWTPYTGHGVDTRLLELEKESLTDPAVQEAYEQVIQCISAVNLGIGLEHPCDRPTPVLVSLVDAEADPDRVTLAWHVSAPGGPVTIERRLVSSAWTALKVVHADGTGIIRHVDEDVASGGSYGYRLTLISAGAIVNLGEVWVEVPIEFRLSLAGFVPNPAHGIPTVEFVLPSRDRARLELFDLQGRRVLARDVGHLGPGRVALAMDGVEPLRPGVYVLTLAQRDQTTSKKGAIIR